MKRFVRWLNPMVWMRRVERLVWRGLILWAIKEIGGNDKRLVAQMMAREIEDFPAWHVEAWELTDREAELLFGMMFWLSKEESNAPHQARAKKA